MDVSIVIPCKDGAATLARQLDALTTQVTDARFEVLVADNGSTDDSRAVVARYPQELVRLVDASTRRHSRARTTLETEGWPQRRPGPR